ncbi:HAD family hydrolase [Chloroflexota bacterium]
MATKALIWDLDGVIADTAPFHFRAWQRVAHDQGIAFTEADFKQTFGKRNPEIIAEKFGPDFSAQEVEDLASNKEELFRRIAKQSIKPFPGVLNLMLSLRAAMWKMAIASSTPVENIKLITQSLDIAGLFDAVVSDKDVLRGKPDPEVFMLAADKLEAAPADCIVIEDAVAGVRAAKDAGMKCIAVTNTNPADKLAEADMIVDSLETVSVDTLEALLR